MQAPMGGARHDRFTRKLRAVQEKQQADRDVRQPIEADRSLPMHRQQAGENHGAHEAQGEIIREQFRASHVVSLFGEARSEPDIAR
jgi:hypothetical protein